MTDTFHRFSDLPAELQLMVWQQYRQDRRSMRHYFRLGRRGRYHAAYNPTTGAFERATARTAADACRDPLDPTEAKIRFTGRVRAVLDYGPGASPVVAERRLAGAVDVALGCQGGAHPRNVTTSHAWVNFTDDVFIFENSGYARPGKLRFLTSRIHRARPTPPAPGSWPARIRTLALYLDRAPLTASDHDVLRVMEGLRMLLLVSSPSRACMPLKARERHEVAPGYVDAEFLVKHHRRRLTPHASGLRTDCRCCKHWQREAQGMEKLLQSLGKGGVKVKMVLDCRQQNIPVL